MKHNSCQDFLKIYCENPDKIKMLILFEDAKSDKIIGRSLLWDLGNYKIMDRIYTCNDNEYTIHFKNWASKNGYLHKSDQNWYSTLFFENENQEKQEIKIEVELKNYNYSKYPYLDTFKFLNMNTGTLKNYIDDNEDSLLYTIQAMHFLFGQEISAEEIMTLVPGTEEDSYVMRYDEDYASLRLEFCDISEAEVEITDTNVAEDNYDFKTDCSIVSYDDTSCTYDVYWTPGSYGEHLPNGRFAPVRDIATITVTFDFDDSYDLGFIITNIQVERAQ